MNFNFSITNLNSLPILIKPEVEQLTETNFLKIKFRNDLSTDVRIYYIHLLAQITTTKRFRTDDVTSNMQRKARNRCNLNTIVERQSSITKISSLIPKQVTYYKKPTSSGD